jgi:hypothetical protein
MTAMSAGVRDTLHDPRGANIRECRARGGGPVLGNGARHMHRNPSSLRFLSISIIVGVAGCPGGSDLDARQLSTLSDDELVELCTDLGAGLSAEAREGWKRRACVAEVDCLADPDAYEACAAAADDDILQCDDVPPDDAPIRGCEGLRRHVHRVLRRLPRGHRRVGRLHVRDAHHAADARHQRDRRMRRSPRRLPRAVRGRSAGDALRRAGATCAAPGGPAARRWRR